MTPQVLKARRCQQINKWGLFWWCPKKALARNKPGVTHYSEHLEFRDCRPIIFQTRKEAREYAEKKYGYIKTRKDVREFPHFWRMPIPVRITGIQFEYVKAKPAKPKPTRKRGGG